MLGGLYRATGDSWRQEKQQIEGGYTENLANEQSRRLTSEGLNENKMMRRVGGKNRLTSEIGRARSVIDETAAKAVEGYSKAVAAGMEAELRRNPGLDKIGYLTEQFNKATSTSEKAAVLELLRGQGSPGASRIGELMDQVADSGDKALFADLNNRVAGMSDVEGRNALAVEAAKRGLSTKQLLASPGLQDVMEGIKDSTWATQNPGSVADLQRTNLALYNKISARLAANGSVNRDMKDVQRMAWGIGT